MTTPAHIAKNLREIHFGGNWTASSMKEQLADVTWLEATTQVYSFNTIAALVYHVNYYVSATLKVLQGMPLEADDKYSFDLPPIASEDDWQRLLERTWAEAENFASMIEQLPESILDEYIAEEKYGTYYRNLQGIIEHMHYHLGQIVLIRKIIRYPADAPVMSSPDREDFGKTNPIP